MTDTKHDDGGMARDKTLLDEFAGQVLAGVLNGPVGRRLADKSGSKDVFREVVAEMTYDIAAAMVAEKRRREAVE